MAPDCPYCGDDAIETPDERSRCLDCALIFQTSALATIICGPSPEHMHATNPDDDKHRAANTSSPLNPPTPDEWVLEFLDIEKEECR